MCYISSLYLFLTKLFIKKKLYKSVTPRIYTPNIKHKISRSKIELKNIGKFNLHLQKNNMLRKNS